MQEGFGQAQRYVDHGAALREVLGIPVAADLRVHELAQGEHNSNFWFENPASGERYVLRLVFSSQLGIAAQARYEFDALGELAASGRAPRPLFVDDSCAVIDRQLLVESFCPGRMMDYDRAEDMAEVAAVIADTHAVTPSEACALMAPPDPLRDQLDECRRLFAGYERWEGAEGRVLRAVGDLLAVAEEAVSAAPAPQLAERRHILNTEGVASHFLLAQGQPAAEAPAAPRLRGSMVDWEKPILGEVAQDVAYLLSPTTTIWDTETVLSAEQRQAFLEAYWRAVDGRFARGSFDERLGAYAMTNCLRGITWSANALVEYQRPDRPLQNEKTRRRLGWYVDERFLAYVRRMFFAR